MGLRGPEDRPLGLHTRNPPTALVRVNYVKRRRRRAATRWQRAAMRRQRAASAPQRVGGASAASLDVVDSHESCGRSSSV